MRFIRLVAAACALPLAAAATLLGTDAAGATGPAYAALGDSYSAGVGAGDYLGSSGACERSAKAYPRLWADAHAPSSFAFTACDGATTTDVTNNQLGPLSQSTSLVSITVGADDAGFGRVMTTCVLSSDTACLSRIAQAEDYIRGTLPARLDHVYSAIRAKAPAAHVVVLGYPRFYKVNGLCRAGMSEAKRSAVNQAADEVDSVIARRAADHGFTFRDVRPAFAPHEICGGDPWLHSVTIPVGDSYHPTARGQSGGYLPEFTAAAS